MTHILDDFAWRGIIATSTDLDALRQAMDGGPITVYCGFDPTAPSLHHGHLMQLITLRRLQAAGHRPIALVGGATGLIGDPKPSAERTLNDPSVVAGWVDRIRAQVTPFLDFSGDHAALMANNLDWTAGMSAIELLRDVGKHFRVNRMIAKEVVRARLESDAGISYTEFSYQILQSLDFLELYRRHGCTMQIGGSDQWGNLTAGLDLIHKVEQVAVHALATRLVTKADGTKFGKTEGGAVWLDPAMTSPYGFYQFWVNTDDRDVVNYLKFFSQADRDVIEGLANAVENKPAAREAQRFLAAEMTTLVHGADECARVIAASAALFGRGELTDLAPATLEAALRETGLTSVPGHDSRTVVDLLVACGLVDSKSGARRVVDEGGCYLNNRKITSTETAIAAADLLHGRWVVLRRGKRSVAAVEFS